MKYTHILLLPLVVAGSLNCMEKQKQQWEIIRTFEQTGNVHAVDLYKNANILAMASGDMESHLWRLDTNRESESFYNNDQITRAISVESYRNLLATGSDNGIARVIDTYAGKETHSFKNKDIISAIKFNHASNQLAVAANHTVRLFDLRAKKRFISLQHQDQPISVCFDKYDTAIVTASLNKVRVFDIRTKNKIKSFHRDNRYIASVLINDLNDIVTVETPGDTIQIYNKNTKEITDTRIPVTIDRMNYLCGGPDSVDRFYDEKPLFSICLHPSSKMLALGLFGKALVFAQNDKK